MGEVLICMSSFASDSNFIKNEALPQEVQGGTGRKWKNLWRYLRNLYIELPYDPAIPLLRIYPDETLLKRDTCTRMFIAALYTIPRHGNNPNVHQQMIRLGRCGVYIHNGILLSHKKE